MRFQLPQFIETETKIVGPFTLKQFLWIAGGASFIFLLYSLTSGVLFFTLALPIGGVFLAFAFYKVDDVPLIVYASYGLSYILNPKKYVFKKENNEIGNYIK
ncbi:MAG: PrgI family protein [Candidatus Yanofskybacteria bacterium]|nr:PrgI family protein [Candidatus Yanofskybacteria bacterium]